MKFPVRSCIVVSITRYFAVLVGVHGSTHRPQANYNAEARTPPRPTFRIVTTRSQQCKIRAKTTRTFCFLLSLLFLRKAAPFSIRLVSHPAVRWERSYFRSQCLRKLHSSPGITNDHELDPVDSSAGEWRGIVISGKRLSVDSAKSNHDNGNNTSVTGDDVHTPTQLQTERRHCIELLRNTIFSITTGVTVIQVATASPSDAAFLPFFRTPIGSGFPTSPSATDPFHRPEDLIYTLAPNTRAFLPFSIFPLAWSKGSSGSFSSFTQANAPPFEVYMLRLLPVKNSFYRRLVEMWIALYPFTFQGSDRRSNSPTTAASTVTAASLVLLPPAATTTAATSSATSPTGGKPTLQSLREILTELDSKRNQLEPVFNPDDPTLLVLRKGERCEQLIDTFQQQIENLISLAPTGIIDSAKFATSVPVVPPSVVSRFMSLYRTAILTLCEIGELLVPLYPYDIPSWGRYSYLPRLQGRARVTFRIRRPGQAGWIGNITVLVDGYAAPITAGNFLDLSMRNFYTGLPIRWTKKRIGWDKSSTTPSRFDVATIPLFGSFQEGFYDPLTAQVRRIPLEVVRIRPTTQLPYLTYTAVSTRGRMGTDEFPTERITTPTQVATPTISSTSSTGSDPAMLEPASNLRPLISFATRGVVAMNHPDRTPWGSSEFFVLRDDSTDQPSWLDGEYAPFGYVIHGMDLIDSVLQPNDVIDETVVDDWGTLNLVKLRLSRFSEVVKKNRSIQENDDA